MPARLPHRCAGEDDAWLPPPQHPSPMGTPLSPTVKTTVLN